MLQISEHQRARKYAELKKKKQAVLKEMGRFPHDDPMRRKLMKEVFKIAGESAPFKPPPEPHKPVVTVSNVCTITEYPEMAGYEIQKRLQIQNPKYANVQKYGKGGHWRIPELLSFSRVKNELLIIPRGCFRQALEVLKKHGAQPILDDRRRSLDPIELNFNGQLRDYQQRAVDDVLARAFGVLSAATGSGKTIIALAVIAARRQPTLILVHTKELLGQWGDRIKQFLGIEAGVIGGGKFDVQPVTVGIVNTVRKHLDSLPENFGQVIVDESHRVPSSMFTEAVQAFDCKYMLGLSATAYRRDGLDPLIFWALGQKVHQVDPRGLKQIGAVLTPEIVRRETAFQYQYEDDYPAMISNLTRDRERNMQIAADVIRQAQSRPGACLVVSDRVQHCMDLAGLLEGHNLSIRVLTGRTKAKDRKAIVEAVQAGTVNVLVSTVQLLGEGFDCPGLSSLFLATPIKFKGRVLQVVGRILRPADGKRPAVFDFVDELQPVLRVQSRSRARALKEVSA